MNKAKHAVVIVDYSMPNMGCEPCISAEMSHFLWAKFKFVILSNITVTKILVIILLESIVFYVIWIILQVTGSVNGLVSICGLNFGISNLTD